MPLGELPTLPEPLTLTVRLNVDGTKVAVVERAAVIATVQVPVPEHPPPLHPLNVNPDAGAAVSVTDVPLL